MFVNEIAAVGLLRYRGKRAGALARSRQVRASVYTYKHDPDSKHEHISIVPSCRLSRRQVELPREHALIKIERAVVVRPVNIGVLNIQCLKNKSAVVVDTIVSKSLDLFALVESWHDSADTPSIIASTPPGYRVFERARQRTEKQANSLKINHGGICVFVRTEINATVVDFPAYNSFELLPLFVRDGALSFVFVVVYRPDPALAVTAAFFVDFADVLERTSSFAGCVLAGDVSVHLERRPVRTRRYSTRCLTILLLLLLLLHSC